MEVRNIILILSSLCFIAFLLVVGAIYYFTAANTYPLKQVLFKPTELNEQTLIEFTVGEKRFGVGLSTYKAFYNRIASERSVPLVTSEMEASFQKQPPSSLVIQKEHTGDKTKTSDESPRQELQFSESGDLFRIKSDRQQKNGWLYFRYPGIYQQANEFFAH
jgi:hypothetical protein